MMILYFDQILRAILVKCNNLAYSVLPPQDEADAEDSQEEMFQHGLEKAAKENEETEETAVEADRHAPQQPRNTSGGSTMSGCHSDVDTRSKSQEEPVLIAKDWSASVSRYLPPRHSAGNQLPPLSVIKDADMSLCDENKEERYTFVWISNNNPYAYR